MEPNLNRIKNKFDVKSVAASAQQWCPFNLNKIYSFFNQELPGVILAKGFFWLSSRPDFVGEVSQAGAFVRHQGIGRWWASIPKER